jgi:hypothetical protein
MSGIGICVAHSYTTIYAQGRFFKGGVVMAHRHAKEAVSINIRAKARQRDLIDQAAERLGRSRSDFMLEASCQKAGKRRGQVSSFGGGPFTFRCPPRERKADCSPKAAAVFCCQISVP